MAHHVINGIERKVVPMLARDDGDRVVPAMGQKNRSFGESILLYEEFGFLACCLITCCKITARSA
jgi:outer membrane PBP1 activator LpoA protein